jgi:hypothetical protein
VSEAADAAAPGENAGAATNAVAAATTPDAPPDPASDEKTIVTAAPDESCWKGVASVPVRAAGVAASERSGAADVGPS